MSASNSNPFAALADVREKGMMPRARMVWIGLDLTPKKRSMSVRIDSKNPPTVDDCIPVVGLDVVLLIDGYLTSYVTLRRLTGALLEARPRRLILVDRDYRKCAFLKLGG